MSAQVGFGDVPILVAVAAATSSRRSVSSRCGDSPSGGASQPPQLISLEQGVHNHGRLQ